MPTKENKGVKDPKTKTGYNFYGWSFSNKISEIVKADTTYAKTEDSSLYAQYYTEDDIVEVILLADTGLFSNGKRELEIQGIKMIKMCHKVDIVMMLHIQ